MILRCRAISSSILRDQSLFFETKTLLTFLLIYKLETEKDILPIDVHELLKHSPGIDIIDNPGKNKYPMPISRTQPLIK